MNDNNDNDIIIIGGGLAGLYLCYELSKQTSNITLYEKNDFFGGKILSQQYNDIFIDFGPTQAKDTDTNLKNLCQELEIPIKEFDIQHLNVDYENIKKKLYNIYKTNKDKIINLNFETFCQIYVEPKDIRFLHDNFLFDYIWIYDTHYIFNSSILDDVGPRCGKYFTIDNKKSWQYLIDKLIDKCLEKKVILNSNVECIEIIPDEHAIIINRSGDIHKDFYKKLYLACDSSIKNLKGLPYQFNDILKNLLDIPLLTLYLSSKENNTLPVTSTIFGCLSKIDNYLISSRTDSDKANFLINLLQNNSENLLKILENYGITNIDKIFFMYWENGLNIYSENMNFNIKTNKYNMTLYSNDICLLGNYVSMKQGTMEGSIESVNNYLT